ncbi:hypothetical protein DMUE_2847 [Dictyocoela muelleri]|nr:hypothetical protein DMUE_2847 [Dictyocoela muelleri]
MAVSVLSNPRRRGAARGANFRVSRINTPPSAKSFPSIGLAVQACGKIYVGPSNSAEDCNPLELFLCGYNGTDMELVISPGVDGSNSSNVRQGLVVSKFSSFGRCYTGCKSLSVDDNPLCA